MSAVDLADNELDTLSDAERRALRISRFAQEAPPTASSSRQSQLPRLAHPGGPIATNKAAALARFLKRKVDAGTAGALDLDLVELAVRNAKSSIAPTAGGRGQAKVSIRHVAEFEGDEVPTNGEELNASGGGYNKAVGRKKKKSWKSMGAAGSSAGGFKLKTKAWVRSDKQQ